MRFEPKGTLAEVRGIVAVAMTVVLTSIAGCSSSRRTADDPKAFLQDYISQSFAVNQVRDRDVLIRYLTGAAKTRLAAWSDEQFVEAFINSKRQFVKLAFSEVKTQNPREVAITYELTYLDQSKGHDAKVTHKKFAQLVRSDEKWLISEVRNLKELIEYKNEMSLP